MLRDSHNRIINYVRLAVTDRCNLRCTYCMPENMQFLQRKELLTYEEILAIMRPLAAAGVNKIRITGGEPFLRRDLMHLLTQLSQSEGIHEIAITTNGVLTAPFIPQLKALGINNINLSLDTLQRDKFKQITHRDQFNAVMHTLDNLLEQDMHVKLNMVVMGGVNTDELLDFAALTAHKRVTVRFIEEMPFNGQGHAFSGQQWNYRKILDTLNQHYELQKLEDAPHSTSLNYHIPGHQGRVGVIAAYSRTFCGTCNRIRITPTGGFKTCLYGHDVLNVRDLLRNGASSDLLMHEIQAALNKRAANGVEAEKGSKQWDSMSMIGG
ncbi:cyclic pyranopterin monophosphate synthase subunit MoaA [Chitinophaga sp. CF118]|uniref:GTP 3',8-cyclase MoaA n=1 Tax=Chitinophaga sp. CF118 TaxID=1884367 RepID=UPI0008E1D431|nr:GTP 3',8-cyclase MoaA [Chitinophaga sp. CF118]SFD25235.1 cyclic pyranopterin monophosphate synthase subunit MoaA [Chitinophaga sp. CF118]